MKKIRRKTKKASEKKAAESTSKLDALISRDKLDDKLNDFDRRINANRLAIDDLLAKPKKFDPIVTADPVVTVTPAVLKVPLVNRYDDVCKEIDKEIK